MRKITFILALMTVLAWILARPVPVDAKGGNGWSGNGVIAAGQGGAQSGARHGQTGSGSPTGKQVGSLDRQRQRIHLSAGQRGDYRNCTGAAEQTRQQARSMAKVASGKGGSAAELRRQHQQLEERVGAMLEQHDRFMAGLSRADRGQLQEHVSQVDRTRERIQSSVRDMDRELARSNPDASRVTEQARELERATKEWQKQYRKIGSELEGVS